jgi:tetratricopeptide (TPR) repeat protein
VDVHLQRAASLISSREASIQALKEAEKAGPDQIEVLVARFKLHFYQGETEAAEKLAMKALKLASVQGGFNHDWTQLQRHSTDWNDPRAPARLYLYSLKALAFIRLREDNRSEARSILNALARLDPQDQVGADVIRDLLNAIAEDENDG